MNLLQAIFLGFIQGVSEFLPISSSGHLAIFKNIFGLREAGLAFDVLLHLGTLVAVFIVYWRDIVRLIIDGVGIIADSCYNVFYAAIKNRHGRVVEYRGVINTAYRKFALLVIVSTIPTAIIGVTAKGLIEEVGKTLIVPGICLLITGVLLLISDLLTEGKKTPNKATYGNAFFIGITQGIATLPGLSRSGTTITASLFCGFRRDFAVKYSFIMSIPAILGAVVLDVKNLFTETVTSAELANYVVGTAIAAIVGYICIKTMLVVVRNKKFKYFAYYCFTVGAIAIIYHIFF